MKPSLKSTFSLSNYQGPTRLGYVETSQRVSDPVDGVNPAGDQFSHNVKVCGRAYCNDVVWTGNDINAFYAWQRAERFGHVSRLAHRGLYHDVCFGIHRASVNLGFLLPKRTYDGRNFNTP